MLTFFVYLINSIILLYFSFKLIKPFKEKHNPYILYFLGAVFLYGLGFLFYDILILLAVLSKEMVLLFWSDYVGRIFFYLGSVFAIQIVLYKFWPKSKLRFLASWIIFLVGAYLAVYNLFNQNRPFIDSLGIIHWQASDIIGIGFAAIILGIWIPTGLIFLQEYIQSKFRSVKSLFLGSGFLLSSGSAIFQDFSFTSLQFLLISLIMSVGFILIFVGLSYEKS